MKTLFKILSLALVFAMLSALLLPMCALADETSTDSKERFSVPDKLEDVSPEDTDVPVEKAAPDYWVIVKLVLGVAIGGLVIYFLVKPKKK
jgi:hypothetical protein